MQKDPNEKIHDLLAEMDRLAGKANSTRTRTRRRWWLLIPAILAPFPILLRLSTWLYVETAWPVAICMAAAVAAAASALVLPILVVARRRRLALGGFAARASVLLLAGFVVYGLLYLSPSRFKRAEVAETYRSLHPMLRVSVSALVLVDGELVITDAARRPEDYAAMGLPVYEGSLHFEQSDGWVHAVDFRTRGRSDLANGLVALYFRSVGMSTLRHVGTADHLHISLGLPPQRR